MPKASIKRVARRASCVFWLKDESLDDGDSLPPPDEIAAEIVENLQAALEAFQSVAEELATPK